MPIYAIGDIHGHLDLLLQAHERIARDGGRDARIVHLGDLIDRGPDSRGVVAHLMQGQAAGRDWIVLRGNHDSALPEFLRDPHWVDPRAAMPANWIARDVGADTTLASYGVADAARRPLAEVHAEALAAVPAADARWLGALPLWHRQAGALFVHAGIRPGVALAAQDPGELMWIRRPFLDDPRDHGVLVVHGHTPIRRATHYGNRINIDSGAGRGGPLSAIRLDGGGAWLLTGDGPQPLHPAGPG
ncbi:metallophosphoesterase [Paracoccus sp. (in: a-proteobacteria)]